MWSRRDLNPDESPENLRFFNPKCFPKWPFRYTLPHLGQTLHLGDASLYHSRVCHWLANPQTSIQRGIGYPLDDAVLSSHGWPARSAVDRTISAWSLRSERDVIGSSRIYSGPANPRPRTPRTRRIGENTSAAEAKKTSTSAARSLPVRSSKRARPQCAREWQTTLSSPRSCAFVKSW